MNMQCKFWIIILFSGVNILGAMVEPPQIDIRSLPMELFTEIFKQCIFLERTRFMDLQHAKKNYAAIRSTCTHFQLGIDHGLIACKTNNQEKSITKTFAHYLREYDLRAKGTAEGWDGVMTIGNCLHAFRPWGKLSTLFKVDYYRERSYEFYKIIKNTLEDLDDPNYLDKYGNRPLHYALSNAWIPPEIIKLLLDYGARVGKINPSSENAIEYLLNLPYSRQDYDQKLELIKKYAEEQGIEYRHRKIPQFALKEKDKKERRCLVQ